MNASKQGFDDPCDICVYDVRKCFDKLWMEECINDLFEAGLTNDKLCLIYHSNKTARIAIKTPSGMTERFSIYKKSHARNSMGRLNVHLHHGQAG